MYSDFRNYYTDVNGVDQDGEKKSRQPVKYYTTNFHNKGCNPIATTIPGAFTVDGQNPLCAIKNNNKLRSKTTHGREKRHFGAPPKPTVPYMGHGKGNANIESSLRPDNINFKKSDREHEILYDRIFEPGTLKYNPNVVWHTNPAGIDTRHYYYVERG